MKKRGFGAGRWNGFGGKLQEGETIEQGAMRELKEEAGIETSNLEKIGVLDFSWEKNPTEILQVHIFKVISFTGIPTEGEEMKPEWYAVENIPFAKMWPDDIFWFPLLLAGKKFTGSFLFGENDVVLQQELTETESI